MNNVISCKHKLNESVRICTKYDLLPASKDQKEITGLTALASVDLLPQVLLFRGPRSLLPQPFDSNPTPFHKGATLKNPIGCTGRCASK